MSILYSPNVGPTFITACLGSFLANLLMPQPLGTWGFLAVTKQFYEWFSPSVCTSVTPFYYPRGWRGIVVTVRAGGCQTCGTHISNLLTDFRQSPFKVLWNCLGLYCSCALSGLSVDIFCWGSGAPTIWISKGPQQNLMGPFIEIHYQLSNFGGPLGPQAKFHKGPIGFSGARGPYLRAPSALTVVVICTFALYGLANGPKTCQICHKLGPVLRNAKLLDGFIPFNV